MSNRRRLPNRRLAVNMNFYVDGIKFIATIGYFQRHEPAEIFINTSQRQGSAADIAVADAALAASLALQYGCPVDVLRAGMKRNKDGRPQGPLGAILDLLSEEQ